MPEIGNLEDRLLHEIGGMREDFRRVSVELGALATEVRLLTQAQEATKTHSERLARLETEVQNVKADMQSANTERRWIIGVLVAGALALIGSLITFFSRYIH